MTSLSASALDLDPQGCAFLTSVISSGTGKPQRPWMRAALGFTTSTASMIVTLVAVASWTS